MIYLEESNHQVCKVCWFYLEELICKKKVPYFPKTKISMFHYKKPFWGLFQIILWIIFILAVKKLRQDVRRSINNIFRNMQYSILIGLCLVDIIQGFTRFIPKFILGIYAFNIYGCYFYQWGEFINISWWIDFSIQMNVYHNPNQFKVEKISITRRKEKWFSMFYGLAMVLYLVPAIILNFMIYTGSWLNWDPFVEENECSSFWKSLSNGYYFLFKVLAIVWLLIIIVKIAWGVLLIRQMKKNLYFFYLQKRSEVLLTIIWTSFITLWKGFYIFKDLLRENDVKDHYMRRDQIAVKEIPFQVLIWFIDIQ